VSIVATAQWPAHRYNKTKAAVSKAPKNERINKHNTFVFPYSHLKLSLNELLGKDHAPWLISLHPLHNPKN